MRRNMPMAAAVTALFFAFGGRHTESFSTTSHPMSLLVPRRSSSASAAATRLLATPPSFRDNNDKPSSDNTGFFDPLELSSAGRGDDDLNSSIQASAIFTTTTEDEPTNGNGNGELGLWAARGLLLLVAAIWGTNFASVKYLELLCFHPPCNHPPSEAAFARFGVAALIGLPLLLKQRWEVIRAGLECGLFIFLGYATQALALSSIDSGRCAFICSLTVVFVPVVSYIVYGKPMKMTNVVAAVVALAGVGVLEGLINVSDLLGVAPAVADSTGPAIDVAAAASAAVASSSAVTAAGGALSEASTGPLAALAETLGVSKGDLLALGQPIGFGYCFTRIEYYQEEFKDVPNRVLTIAAAQCVAVGILAFFWVLYDYHWTLPNFGYMLEPHRLATIGWTGIVTTVFAIFLEGIALQTATATDAALIFSTEPLWAGLFGFILLNERLGRNDYIGGSIILVACLIGSVSDLLASKKVAEPESFDIER